MIGSKIPSKFGIKSEFLLTIAIPKSYLLTFLYRAQQYMKLSLFNYL